MSSGWLVDAVTLRHFGVVGRLSVLEQFLGDYEPPYWTATVRSEILSGFGRPGCDEVLASARLGQPLEVSDGDLLEVFRIQVALGGGGDDGLAHLGEAESIVLADLSHRGVITDDNGAYDIVQRRLGSNRALDTIEVLRASVRSQTIDAYQAAQLADAIRNTGRHLRRVHPNTLTAAYFL